MEEELPIEVVNALKIVWKQYFPDDMYYEECINSFKDDLKCHSASDTLCDMFIEKLTSNEVLTVEEQKAYAVLFAEETKNDFKIIFRR